MKICVYAIAKNEMKFIDRWYNSVKEADYICVLDTGSTDGSFEKFKSLNIITKQKTYEKFRFDTARNDSLKLIPDDVDICVCIDLDEFFNPGWSLLLKKHWKPDTTRARYRYTWNFNPDGSEGVVFFLDKIHKKDYYNWINPVHEILNPIKQNQKTIDIPQIQLNHKADNSKPRSNYLPLLELAVKENPNNDRNTHYLAREYMFYKQYNKAIEMFKKHLNLPSATWLDERCASLRYIANCYKHLNKPAKYEEYLLLAILENNNLREPYFELAIKYYSENNFLKAAYYLEEMLKIKNRNLSYITLPECWNETPYDYLSICYYELKKIKKAITCAEIALKFKFNERINNNLEIFKSILNNSPN